MKKLILITLIITILFSVSCQSNENSSSENSEESDTSTSSETTSEPAVVTEGILVTIKDNTFEIKNMNTPSIKGVTFYDRNYNVNGEYMMYLPDVLKNDYVITVKRSISKGVENYSILKIIKPGEEKNDVAIPLNGFAVVIPNGEFDSDYSIRLADDIQIENWDKPEYERLDISYAMPDNRNNSRRINMLVPKDNMFAEGKIYLITEKDKVTVPDNSIAVLLTSGSIQNFSGFAESGKTIENTQALLFTGKYNVAYAKEFFKEGMIRVMEKQLLNNISDYPSFMRGTSDKNTVPYTFENKLNVTAENDGIFLFTSENNSTVTSAKGRFRDVVVVANRVCFIGEENIHTLIPTSHGYVLTFSGSYADDVANYSLGDSIESFLIEDLSNPNQFVRINGYEYEFSSINVKLTSENPVVLYNTKEGFDCENCIEMSLSDGKVTSISDAGNMQVPQNGYVLSILKSQVKFKRYLDTVKIGDNAMVSLAGNSYSYQEFSFTAMNTTRLTDYTVIYNRGGSYTNTNQYGFEFAVDQSGRITEGSYSGNLLVPKNGFVVSAHGAAVVALEKAFTIGAVVKYDQRTKKVSVFKTPELSISNAEITLQDKKSFYEDIKEEFASVDYKTINQQFADLSAKMADSRTMYNSGDIGNAILLANSVSASLDTMQYNLYESLPVENRSVWYRANEKSDADVLKTVKLMAEMGVNTMYIETWYNGSVIGYSDNPLIKHHSVHGNYDALKGFCDIAHQYGIEVHIWVENFFIGGPNTSLSVATKDHHLIDKKGRDSAPTPSYGDFVFLNPFDSYSQDLVMSVYREILRKYDIDGIHLDYIRFPEANMYDGADFGYNDDIVSAFQNKYNTKQNPATYAENTAMWVKWNEFRENIINQWVGRVYDMVQEEKPGLCISCAVANNYPASKVTIYQNFSNWVENGWIDEVFSMSYCSDLKTPANNIRTFMNYTKDKCFYSIGLSAFESSPSEILVGQIQVARDNNAFGSNLFSWGSLITHSENYFDSIKSRIWSTPAVRTDKGNITVQAYCQRFIDDLDNVYAFLAPEDSSTYNLLNAKAEAILSKAKATDYASEKQEYLTSAISDLEDMIAVMKQCSNKKASAAMIADAEFIVKCLKMTH